MNIAFSLLGLMLISSGLNEEVRSEDYMEIPFSSSTKETDGSEDFDKFEINEYEDPVTKNYHCTLQNRIKNKTFTPDPEIVKYLDDNGILSVRPRRHNYQVRQIRRKLCQFGFDPFQPDNKAGSLHKRFKNTLRLMIYNTPGIFPGLKIIRNDLDRRRRREPQIWFRFEMNNGPLQVEFDYDNYFVTVSGDLSRIQAYSKMLVALKLHKRLNNFNDSISYKVNLDLGIMEVVLTSFGMWVMKDKSIGRLMENALNGIRTEVNSKGEVRLEFEQTLKDAADKIDPLLYSHVWLLSMAEKYEVVDVREGTQSDQDTSRNVSNDQGVTRSTREASFAVIDKINLLI